MARSIMLETVLWKLEKKNGCVKKKISSLLKSIPNFRLSKNVCSSIDLFQNWLIRYDLKLDKI